MILLINENYFLCFKKEKTTSWNLCKDNIVKMNFENMAKLKGNNKFCKQE